MNPGGRSRPVSVSDGEYVGADRLQRAHGVPQIELGFYPDDMSRRSFEADPGRALKFALRGIVRLTALKLAGELPIYEGNGGNPPA